MRISYYCLLLVLWNAGGLTCKQPIQHEEYNGRTYYLHHLEGDDQNPGTLEKPFRSIARVNQLHLQPGDRILFYSAQTYPGPLIMEVEDSGLPGKEITVSSFDASRAYIDGGIGPAIICKASHVNISNFRLMGKGVHEGNTTSGLIIQHASNVQVENLEIDGFQKSGLEFVSVKNCLARLIYAHDNGFAGISSTHEYGVWNEDLTLAYCRVYNNKGDPANVENHSGNGIVLSYVHRGSIRKCSAYENGGAMPHRGNGPVGIWVWAADHIVISHCLAHDNHTSPGSFDGGGFDLDGGTSFSLIEYCLSYRNEGPGYGLFQFKGASPWHHNVLRYCISEDDGLLRPDAALAIWNGDRQPMSNAYIHNNVFYNSQGHALKYDVDCVRDSFYFFNNIFVGKAGIVLDSTGQQYSDIFEANDWYSLDHKFRIGQESSFSVWCTKHNIEMKDNVITGFNLDPLFELNQTDYPVVVENMDAWIKFKLNKRSPLNNRGASFSFLSYPFEKPTNDLWGNPVVEGTPQTIGAHIFVK